MRSIAVFAVKGGVGKTSIAVNLAHAAATLSGRRTLLWDLDPQGAATWTLNLAPRPAAKARKALQDGELDALIQTSEHANLDVLPADKSLRHLERGLAEESDKWLRKRLKALAEAYDRVIIDCPPGLTALAEQLFRAVDLVVVPVIPSPLSERALEQLAAHLDRHHDGKAPALFPVFSMVDRRRALHRSTLATAPDRPAIPYAAAVEAMAASRQPVLAASPAAPAGRAFAALWRDVEGRLLRP